MVRSGELVDNVQVMDGRTDFTRAVTRETLLVPVTQSNRDEFRTVVEIAKTISAPVASGQKIGVVKVMYHDKEVASTDVVLTESVKRKSLFFSLKNFLAKLLIDSEALIFNNRPS